MLYMMRIDKYPLGTPRSGDFGNEVWIFIAESHQEAKKAAAHFCSQHCPRGFGVLEMYCICPQLGVVQQVHEGGPNLIEAPRTESEVIEMGGVKFQKIAKHSIGTILAYTTSQPAPCAP